MTAAYNKIMQQNGMNEFKELVKKWEILSENINESPFNAPIILPDIFLVSGSGTGRTHLLKLLSEYLSDKKKLMDFYGDVKYFEFMLNYCKPGEYFAEIQRLMTEISDAAGFRNEYRGIVYIDVDEWLGHCHEKHFIDFMEYLSDNSDKWLVVLSVTTGAEEKIEGMRSVLSAFLRIEKVTIETPTNEALSQYLFDLIFAYGFMLDDGARKVLSDTVNTLSEAKYFDGYKTVKRLGQDVVYSVYSRDKRINTLTSDDVSEFSSTGDYVKRVVKKIEKVKRIGF